MAIPQRVKEAAAEAEQQLQQLVNPTPQPAAPAANTPPSATPPTAEVPPAPAPAPAPNDPPPAPAPVAAPTDPQTELQRLQQQLTTEAGRRAAQETEVAELRGRIQQMQELLKNRPAEPAPAPAAPPPDLITPADREDFGEDMIDFVQRAIDQRLGRKVEQMLTRMAALEGQLRQLDARAQSVAQSTQELAGERYVDALNRLAPGWEATNEEQAFVDWLKKRDTFSRKTRHELLQSAHAEADAQTVAEFFRAYWQESGTAPAQPAPAQQPAQPASPPVDPNSLVAPAAASAPTPSLNPKGGKIWTQAEIEAVYEDRIKKRMTPERFAELEAEIMKAISEGRVQ